MSDNPKRASVRDLVPGSPVTTIAGNAAVVVRVDPRLPECVVKRERDAELVSHTFAHVQRRSET